MCCCRIFGKIEWLCPIVYLQCNWGTSWTLSKPGTVFEARLSSCRTDLFCETHVKPRHAFGCLQNPSDATGDALPVSVLRLLLYVPKNEDVLLPLASEAMQKPLGWSWYLKSTQPLNNNAPYFPTVHFNGPLFWFKLVTACPRLNDPVICLWRQGMSRENRRLLRGGRLWLKALPWSVDEA